MNTEDKKPTLLDHVDDIRAQFDKINKLAPYLEAWERAGFTSVEDEQIKAARAILSAGLRMRESLYKVERSANSAMEAYEELTAKRQRNFFG